MRWTDLSGLRGKKDKWDDPVNHIEAMYALGLEEAEMDIDGHQTGLTFNLHYNDYELSIINWT